MICANPDLQVIRGGVRVLCAGSLALRYQELGGDVRSIGKPDPAIYQPVLQSLDLPVARVLAVGDALHTDIAGAAVSTSRPAGCSAASMARRWRMDRAATIWTGPKPRRGMKV